MASESSLSEEIRRFEDQHRSQPDSLVFARLADAYRRSGRLDEALEVLEAGLSRHPQYPSGHVVRARTLQELGRAEEALEAFRRVLDLDAQNLVAVRELARAADGSGDRSEARQWYERLAQIDPTSEEARSRLHELQAGRAGAVGELAAPGEGGSGQPETGGGPWERGGDVDVDESASAELEDPTSGEEAVEAILNGDVPHSIRAEDTWWYEDRPQEDAGKPSRDADLLTRTMADLYAEQGLYREAADIYEELLRDSPDDAELAERLSDLRAGARARSGARTTQASVEPDRASQDRESASSGAAPQGTAGDDTQPPASIGRPAGIPVADELRRLLRLGEERATSLPEPDQRGPEPSGPDDRTAESPALPQEDGGGPESDLGRSAEGGGRSEFASEWLRTLEQGT